VTDKDKVQVKLFFLNFEAVDSAPELHRFIKGPIPAFIKQQIGAG